MQRFKFATVSFKKEMCNNMKVGIVLTCHRNIVETKARSKPLTHICIYITTLFTGLVQVCKLSNYLYLNISVV